MSARAKGSRRAASLAAWVLLLAASISLLAVSWGKWSDPIVDSGREWIVPDGLARGELLYRDVIYWFPPLTPYLHALLFRLLGSNFLTLALAGAMTAVATVAALFFALKRVTGRREAFLWCAVAVPALVFMPRGGGAILGMGFRIWQAAALTLWATTLAAKGRPDLRTAVLAGALSGLAGLCRTEWGLASLAACGLAMAVRRGWRGMLLPWAAATVPAVALYGAGVSAFLVAAGPEAVLVDGHVFLTGLPEETQRFLRYASGMHDWSGGMLRLIFSAAIWAGGWILLTNLAARGRAPEWTRGRAPHLAGAAAVVLLYFEYRGSWPMLAFSGAPLAGVAAAAVGLSRRGPAAAALASFGALAVVLSYRKPFNITDWPYVAPSLLFAIVAMAALLRFSQIRAPAAVRKRIGLAGSAALATLALAFFVTRAADYLRKEGVAVPGTSALLHTDPARAAWLARAAAVIRDRTRPEEALVVFPEGEVLNYLSERRNPLRHRLYIPGYLTDANEALVLDELRRVRPAAVVIVDRTTAEYGRLRFGEDYGRAIGRWIAEEYDPTPVGVSGAADRLLLRKGEGRAASANPARGGALEMPGNPVP